MTHVVTDNCHRCRFTECVSVCPVECFHFDDNMTYIDPDVCIDCGGCIPACPVAAIFDTFNMPEELDHWITINKEKSKALPVLFEKLEPLSKADKLKEKLGF